MNTMKWEFVYDSGGDNGVEVEEATGKLSLDETWAFVLSPQGHIALAIPASRVISITTLD